MQFLGFQQGVYESVFLPHHEQKTHNSWPPLALCNNQANWLNWGHPVPGGKITTFNTAKLYLMKIVEMHYLLFFYCSKSAISFLVEG